MATGSSLLLKLWLDTPFLEAEVWSNLDSFIHMKFSTPTCFLPVLLPSHLAASDDWPLSTDWSGYRQVHDVSTFLLLQKSLLSPPKMTGFDGFGDIFALVDTCWYMIPLLVVIFSKGNTHYRSDGWYMLILIHQKPWKTSSWFSLVVTSWRLPRRLMGIPAEKISILSTYNGQKATWMEQGWSPSHWQSSLL